MEVSIITCEVTLGEARAEETKAKELPRGVNFLKHASPPPPTPFPAPPDSGAPGFDPKCPATGLQQRRSVEQCGAVQGKRTISADPSSDIWSRAPIG